jgi:hypothetical protein
MRDNADTTDALGHCDDVIELPLDAIIRAIAARATAPAIHLNESKAFG